MDLQKIRWEGVDWVHLTQDRVKWEGLVNMIMNMQVL
jgi:hypothetical protein